MNAKKRLSIDCRRVELDGTRYVILRESVFTEICRRAGVEPDAPAEGPLEASLDLDRVSLAQKLARRRRAVGLNQSELARRAGIRPETLNRIERGRTTPDFATIRKLVVAINAAEHEKVASASSSTSTACPQETSHDGKTRTTRQYPPAS